MKDSKQFDSKDLLSEIVVYSKYAKYRPELKRRENWEELVLRNAEMHARKYPQIADEIFEVYARSVLSKKVVPSMRSFQFAGKAIEVNNSRLYNCSARKVDSVESFAEIMFLLLGGSGVGFSVQKHHIDQIPQIKKPKESTKRFLVSDDIMGWADAIKVLMKSYTKGTKRVMFDFSDIRPKGSRLVTAGGKAPGPEPLKECINKITKILDFAIEDRGDNCKMKPIEAHDIVCHIADAVMSGGIRRAATISLFSPDDEEMLLCKGNFPINLIDVNQIRSNGSNSEYDIIFIYNGRTHTMAISEWELNQIKDSQTIPWYKLEEQRGRANNSVMLLRSETSEGYFRELMKKVELSKAGEPGIYWTNDLEYGTNPCVEISLDLRGSFCNLTSVNVDDVDSEEEYLQRVEDAAFLGTLQAGYTDFHYLGDQWEEIAKRDSLLGVSMTGIASMKIFNFDLTKAAERVKEINIITANKIGINPAKRTTCVKPEGTSSLVLKCASGIHAWHNDYYVRRIRVNKDEVIYNYLCEKLGSDFIEDDVFNPNKVAVLSVPVKATDGGVIRTESPMDLLNRVQRVSKEWVQAGHTDGPNFHNVSVTVSVKEDEWDDITTWMWENKFDYAGISLLDFDGGTYLQTPFEDITKEEYERLHEVLEHKLKSFAIEDILEDDDKTDLQGEVACSGNGCSVDKI